MAPRITQELKPIDRTRDLQPGESCIVQYKGIDNRKDLWLGIIFPESLMPKSLLIRPHKNSKPETGDWKVPMEERVHGVYMPGKNTYQWIQKKNMFRVEATPPSLLACDVRSDSKIFLSLHGLARKNMKADYWFRMAAEERKVKGYLNRTPGLVFPPKKSVEPDGSVADPLGKSPQKQLLNSRVNGLGDPPAQKRPRLKGNPEGPQHEGHSSNPSTPALNAATGPFEESPSSLFRGARSPDSSGSAVNDTTDNEFFVPINPQINLGAPNKGLAEKPIPKPKVYASAATQTTLEPAHSNLSEDILVDIYIGSGIDQDVFQLTRGTILKCSVLKYYLIDGEHPFVFHPHLYKLRASEFEPIHSFLATGEYNPRLVDLNEAIKPGEDHSIVGDQFAFGRKFALENIKAPEELDAQVLRFGKAYLHAKVFNLPVLQGLTLWKLQAAWNSYPGLQQLGPILECARFLFEERKQFPGLFGNGTAWDPMQNWMVGFLADTIDFCFYRYSEQFWDTLRDNCALQAAVFKRRAENLAKNPGRYLPTDQLILARERSGTPGSVAS